MLLPESLSRIVFQNKHFPSYTYYAKFHFFFFFNPKAICLVRQKFSMNYSVLWLYKKMLWFFWSLHDLKDPGGFPLLSLRTLPPLAYSFKLTALPFKCRSALLSNCHLSNKYPSLRTEDMKLSPSGLSHGAEVKWQGCLCSVVQRLSVMGRAKQPLNILRKPQFRRWKWIPSFKGKKNILVTSVN